MQTIWFSATAPRACTSCNQKTNTNKQTHSELFHILKPVHICTYALIPVRVCRTTEKSEGHEIVRTKIRDNYANFFVENNRKLNCFFIRIKPLIKHSLFATFPCYSFYVVFTTCFGSHASIIRSLTIYIRTYNHLIAMSVS
jgi:hypothetical protein